MCPFESEAQKRFLFAVKPELAKEFVEKTKKGKKLPEKKMQKSEKKGKSKP